MQDNSQLQPKKLTSWKNEPTIEVLKRDFEASKQTHIVQANKVIRWNDIRNVTGKSKPVKIKGRSSIQPKLVRRQAEWRYPALSEPFLNSEKIFQVNPRTFEDLDAAKQNEILLNYQFDVKLNKVKFIDDYVRTVVDEGSCIVQVGWERLTTKEKQVVPVYSYYPAEDEEALAILNQALELKQKNPREYNENIDEAIKASIDYSQQNGGEPVLAHQVGEQEVLVDKVIENKPTVEILNTLNVYVDPTCNGDLDKALFIIKSFETNQAECKKAGIYKNLDKVNWAGNNPNSDGDHYTSADENFNEDLIRKKVVAYEYWGFYDINGTGSLTPIVATWIGSVMIRMEENPFPDGKLPFVIIQYLPVRNSVYGEPDCELLEENQQIMGAITRGLVDILGRSANAQQGFAKGMLDPLNKRRFENGEDYEFNPNLSPQTGYIEHTFNELPQSVLAYVQMLNADAEALTGVKSFSGGMSGDAYGQVAAGIQGAIDAATKRETAILRRLAYGVSEIGNKIIAMNAVFLSEEEVIRVTNKQFITIKREDIKGNFDLKVDINTAEVDQAKAQDLGFMLQTLGPNMDPMITMKILAEIADLKRMPTLAEELRNYQPKPDPIEEAKRQLEVEEEKAKINFITQRANKLIADTNKVNVETNQIASGAQQSFELAKQAAQARANQNLEITKALVKNRKPDEIQGDIDAGIGYNVMTDNDSARKEFNNRLQYGDQATRPVKPFETNEKLMDPMA
nr:MAG TPA: Portal protein [Caudoviricetes sp.]